MNTPSTSVAPPEKSQGWRSRVDRLHYFKEAWRFYIGLAATFHTADLSEAAPEEREEWS